MDCGEDCVTCGDEVSDKKHSIIESDHGMPDSRGVSGVYGEERTFPRAEVKQSCAALATTDLKIERDSDESCEQENNTDISVDVHNVEKDGLNGRRPIQKRGQLYECSVWQEFSTKALPD